MGRIGILCERVRVEEKQLLEALSLEQLPAELVPPLEEPVAIAAAGPAAGHFDGYSLLVDRCANRSASSHLFEVAGDVGLDVLGAGIAGRGNRLDVARALTKAGIARPASYFAGSERAGLNALRSTGYPATLMPLSF